MVRDEVAGKCESESFSVRLSERLWVSKRVTDTRNGSCCLYSDLGVSRGVANVELRQRVVPERGLAGWFSR